MPRMRTIGDSEYGRMRDMLNLPTTEEQDRFCLLLESVGQIFCIDFGYENAKEKFEEYMLDQTVPLNPVCIN